MLNGRRAGPSFALFLLLLSSPVLDAQFSDSFESETPAPDSSAPAGWATMSGDGTVKVSFSQSGGRGLLEVDSRGDQRNIWWAVMRRPLSLFIDTAALALLKRELRVEARVRASEAPRRINLHFNHSRTTDFHSHLMEYDIPDTENWHVISMTTNGFDARPGDEVFVQIALMDWGQDRYRLEIDYLRVDVVDPERAGPDLGQPIPYRPAMPPPESFTRSIPAAQAGTVDSAWPAMNFGSWSDASRGPLIATGGTRVALLRFEFGELQGRAPAGWGLLELSTAQVYRADTGMKDFGLLRITELLGGDRGWRRESVTWENLLAGAAPADVINPQMMIDIEANPEPGGKTFVPVSPPVLTRLLSGHGTGLAIRPLGAIEATFHAPESAAGGPKLYFNLEPEPESTP
jgi:hypothetical protein